MSLDGIWTGELLGPYGWENSGVYVLEKGRILGGNNRHYSSGSFSFSENRYEAQISVRYYGPPRAIFDNQQEQFEIKVTGELKNDVIEATVTRSDGSGTDVYYRMTKRMDVPSV